MFRHRDVEEFRGPWRDVIRSLKFAEVSVGVRV